MYAESRSPFAEIKRKDGRAMTQDDEDALMEFAHLLAVYEVSFRRRREASTATTDVAPIASVSSANSRIVARQRCHRRDAHTFPPPTPRAIVDRTRALSPARSRAPPPPLAPRTHSNPTNQPL